jgi:hypothetical protein
MASSVVAYWAGAVVMTLRARSVAALKLPDVFSR